MQIFTVVLESISVFVGLTLMFIGVPLVCFIHYSMQALHFIRNNFKTLIKGTPYEDFTAWGFARAKFTLIHEFHTFLGQSEKRLNEILIHNKSTMKQFVIYRTKAKLFYFLLLIAMLAVPACVAYYIRISLGY